MDIPEDIAKKLKFKHSKRHPQDPPTCTVISEAKECDVCGKVVRGRKIFIRKVQFPCPRWSQTCNICKKSYNSYTNEWCSEPELRHFLREKNKKR
jgi:hypothetical protein